MAYRLFHTFYLNLTKGINEVLRDSFLVKSVGSVHGSFFYCSCGKIDILVSILLEWWMSVWKFVYKGSRLTLDSLILLVIFSHVLSSLIWFTAGYFYVKGEVYDSIRIPGSPFSMPAEWSFVIFFLFDMAAISLTSILSSAVSTGRYKLAKTLALYVVMLDIATVLPLIIRVLALSIFGKWAGIFGGIGVLAAIFILVYFMEDLEEASRASRMGRIGSGIGLA